MKRLFAIILTAFVVFMTPFTAQPALAENTAGDMISYEEEVTAEDPEDQAGEDECAQNNEDTETGQEDIFMTEESAGEEDPVSEEVFSETEEDYYAEANASEVEEPAESGELPDSVPEEVKEEAEAAEEALAALEAEQESFATVAMDDFVSDWSPTSPSDSTKALTSPSYTTIRDKAKTIIVTNEVGTTGSSGYAAVTANDNDVAVSLGIFQWNGNNAKTLLRYIIAKDNAAAKKILKYTSSEMSSYGISDAYALYNELIGTASWKGRCLKSYEGTKIAALISTDIGVAAQDTFAQSYIYDFLNAATKLGITNAAALVYFCDIATQGGPGCAGIIAKRAIAYAGGASNVMLNEITAATMTYSSVGSEVRQKRRMGTYAAIAAFGWKYYQDGDYPIPSCGDCDSYTKNEIKWLQTNLKRIFAELEGIVNVKVNGTYDDATVQTVKLFQKMTALDVDGLAGRMTVRKMLYVQTMPVTEESSGIRSYISDSSVLTVLKTGASAYQKNDDSDNFTLSVTSNHSSPAITYSSSNTAVAKVTSAGKVVIKGAGKAVITVKQKASDSYAGSAAKIRVYVYSTDPADYTMPTVAMYAGASMKKAQIQWVQAALHQAGYSTEVCKGVWNKKTTKSVTAFQAAAGLEADGIAGTITLGELSNMMKVMKTRPSVSAAAQTGRIKLTWSKAAQASGYYIYRKAAGSSYKRIAVIKKTSTVSYADKTAAVKKVYYYRVAAYRKTGSVVVRSLSGASGKVKRTS